MAVVDRRAHVGDEQAAIAHILPELLGLLRTHGLCHRQDDDLELAQVHLAQPHLAVGEVEEVEPEPPQGTVEGGVAVLIAAECG